MQHAAAATNVHGKFATCRGRASVVMSESVTKTSTEYPQCQAKSQAKSQPPTPPAAVPPYRPALSSSPATTIIALHIKINCNELKEETAAAAAAAAAM